jgi:molecular chaperone Hsp33
VSRFDPRCGIRGPVSRPVSDTGIDDHVLPFAIEPLDVRGRLVRLGPALDRILRRHRYPNAIARVLGEAAALTALLGSALKLEGRFQLQTRTDGVLDMLIVDFDAPGSLRAVARFDPTRLAALESERKVAGAELIGRGHLALTIDQGGAMSRYQGVVALDRQNLEAAAHQYFRQSEQIPTFVRLAVAESVRAQASSWRAGGLMLQFLPASPERQRQAEFDPGDAPAGVVRVPFVEDDAWSEAKLLAGTLEDHELVDPTLSSERLLYRLFHQRGVTVFRPLALREYCRCSAERIETMLRSFSAQERRDMIGDNGLIGVTCEFCSVHREFDPRELEEAGPDQA